MAGWRTAPRSRLVVRVCVSDSRARRREEEAREFTARAVGKGEEEQDGRGADGDRDAAVDGHLEVCGRPQELALHEEEDPWRGRGRGRASRGLRWAQGRGKDGGRTAGDAVGGDEDREGHGARAEREDEQTWRTEDEGVSGGAS